MTPHSSGDFSYEAALDMAVNDIFAGTTDHKTTPFAAR